MPKHVIDFATLAAVGNYLMTRPMCEVEGLVVALRQSVPYAPPEVLDRLAAAPTETH